MILWLFIIGIIAFYPVINIKLLILLEATLISILYFYYIDNIIIDIITINILILGAVETSIGLSLIIKGC